MKNFNEWLFEINITKGKDAHYSLVEWLRRNKLSELFTESYKAITYVIFQYQDGFGLIAKSCVPIDLPIVEHNSFDLDHSQPVKVAVQLSTKKRIRPPCLLHEHQSSTRYKTIVRAMTESEKMSKVYSIIAELGFDPENVSFTIHEGIDIPIHHKREKLFVMEPTMNVVINGFIANMDQFEKAWSYGVGNKRVYGLGCVRVINDE